MNLFNFEIYIYIYDMLYIYKINIKLRNYSNSVEHHMKHNNQIPISDGSQQSWHTIKHTHIVT